MGVRWAGGAPRSHWGGDEAGEARGWLGSWGTCFGVVPQQVLGTAAGLVWWDWRSGLGRLDGMWRGRWAPGRAGAGGGCSGGLTQLREALAGGAGTWPSMRSLCCGAWATQCVQEVAAAGCEQVRSSAEVGGGVAWLGQPGTPQVKRRRVPPGMPAEFHTPFLRALGEPESAASQWRPHNCDWAGAGHLPVLEQSRRDTDPADAGPCGHEWHASPGLGEAPQSPRCIHPPPTAGLGVALGEKTFGSSLEKRARNPKGFLLSMVGPTRRWRRMPTAV